MKGILITVYDGKAETYTPPSVAENNAAAIRQFSILVNDKQHTLISDHPEDFTLFRIASFDGPVVIGEDRLALVNGLDVKEDFGVPSVKTKWVHPDKPEDK